MAPPASSSDGAASSSHIESITSPTCLRKVVLNYLLHHCYADTAAAFAGNTSGGASTSSNGAYNDASSAALASSSNGTETPRRSRHPLAAPPLLRQDSSIEVEADANLVAAGAGVNEESDDADMQDAVTADTTFTAAPAPTSAPPSDVSRPGAEITSSDLRILSLRQEVRGHILDGNIKLATELLNTHFPSVLGEGDGEDGEAEASATPTATTWTTSSGRTAALPSASTSLQPQHLALNLQIQAFIESVRAANAPPQTPAGHHGGGGGAGSAGQSMAATAAAGAAAASSPSTSGPAAPPPLAPLSRSSSPAPSSVSSTSSISTSSSFAPTSSSAPPTALQQALANAQSLYIAVQRLSPGPYQTIYRREIEGVTAILAYKDLERSPLKKFLDTKRRRMLSEQVNAAILFRTGRPSQPLLECAVRQTTWLWTQLNQDGVAVPPSHPVLAANGGSANGVGAARGTVAMTSSTDKSTRAAKGRVMPPWNLPAFLAER